MSADYVMIGGFLGAGKTTAVLALAEWLATRGRRVGLITNDQSVGLVDTTVAASHGFAVEEITGGCFCCRFTDLLDAVQTVLAQEPDVLLCEPVGSCTDMAATVLNPMRRFYRDQFRIAPFTVLADPQRVRENVLQEEKAPFAPEVGFIFDRQLAEADVIARLDRLLAARQVSLQLIHAVAG